MDFLIKILYSKAYKWAYLCVFTITTIISVALTYVSETGIQGVISVLTSVIDWIGIFGFVVRKPFLYDKFWQGWLFWSILWFLYDDGLSMLEGMQYFDPISIMTSAAISAFYMSFFLALYCYSFLERKIWQMQ